MPTQAQFEATLTEELNKEFDDGGNASNGGQFSKRDVQRILDTLSSTVEKELKKKIEKTMPDGTVKKVAPPVVVRGLGRFAIADRAARTGRNPQTGATIKIKASRKLKILPNKPMKDRLKVK